MRISRFLWRSLLLLALVGLLAAGGIAGALWIGDRVFGPELPDASQIQSVELQVPLRIYSADGVLIGEFGAERRAPLRYEDLPPKLIQAFLAAEDDRFFEHPGVDWQGLLRAAWSLVTTGRKSQGGSTITMQLARNLFLSSEQTFTRKFKEILLALRIERELDKRQILTTYLNKIYLGNRAYGVGAAAQVYFGKPVEALSLSEIAILAGLPKAPSRDNPAASVQRAKQRRNYVLRRMRELGYISELEYEAALAEPVRAGVQNTSLSVEAQYVAEMARAELFERFGEQIYTRGLIAHTTLDSEHQRAAVAALRAALTAYDERHGYRGPEARVALAPQPAGDAADAPDPTLEALDERPEIPGTVVAAVTAVVDDDQGRPRLRVLTRERESVLLPADFADWAKLAPDQLPRPGDVIRLRRTAQGLRLTQIPEVQGAFVSLDPGTGAVRALVGGYDFFLSKFNRVTQARRQPGSGFKPFVYAAALDAGFTPASVILDAPVVFDDPALEATWRPQNYTGRIYGPTRLREALVHSRNLVSIRLLQAIGIDRARDYVSRFGFPRERLPRDLSLALGSPVFAPLEIARGYAVLANTGYLVEPWILSRVETVDGELLHAARPARVCPNCERRRRELVARGAPEQAAEADDEPLAPRVIDERIAYLVNDMLGDVVVRGTGARARELGRSDLHGKTGTTNDETDAWFCGYTPSLVAVAWVGFDQPQPLGRGEAGGVTALPMWMDYMRVVLDGVPEQQYARPPGLVTVRIDPATGKLAPAGSPGAIFEIVQAEHVPEPAGPLGNGVPAEDGGEALGSEDIF